MKLTPEQFASLYRKMVFALAAVMVFITAPDGFESSFVVGGFAAYIVLFGLTYVVRRKLDLSKSTDEANIGRWSAALAVLYLYMLGYTAYLIDALHDGLDTLCLSLGILVLVISFVVEFTKELHITGDDLKDDDTVLDSVNHMRSDRGLLRSMMHPSTDWLLSQLAEREALKYYKSGARDSKADVLWVELGNEVMRSILDGYLIGLAQFTQAGKKLSLPTMHEGILTMRAWQEYKTKSVRQQPKLVRKAYTKISMSKARKQMRKANLSQATFAQRNTMRTYDQSWMSLGYNVACFENEYRTPDTKRRIKAEVAKIDADFLNLIKGFKKQKLPVYLAGMLANYLLLGKKLDSIGDPVVHFIAFDEHEAQVVGELIDAGYQLASLASNGEQVTTYEISHPDIDQLTVVLNIYGIDEETGRYYPLSWAAETAGYYGLDKAGSVAYKSLTIKTVPPSYYMQNMLEDWRTNPSHKQPYAEHNFDQLCKRYYKNTNLQTDPLFSYLTHLNEDSAAEPLFVKDK